MADHGYFEELICAELDGELSPEEAAELRAHLEGCERCRAFREAMTAVEGVTARHLPQPPAELTENIMAAVRAEAKKKKKGKILSFPVRSLAVAAAAALVLWAGFRAVDNLRPKGMAAAAQIAAVTEGADEFDDKGVEEEAVQMYESAEEEAMDASEAPAEERAESAGAGVNGNSVPAQGPRANALPSGVVICRISDKDGPVRELPLNELPEGLLVPDKPCDDPGREPDYIILVCAPNRDPKEYRFWEQDGVMIVETAEGEIGYSVTTEKFMQMIKK